MKLRGEISDFFKIRTGVRLGDVLASTLQLRTGENHHRVAQIMCKRELRMAQLSQTILRSSSIS